MTESRSSADRTRWQLAFVVFWRWLVLSQFAIWMGGFTFYTAYVVPVGSDVLGSVRAQGFITQQVTYWMNVVCLVATGFMLVDDLWPLIGRNTDPDIRNRFKYSVGRVAAIACTICIFVLLIWLVFLHQKMDAILVFSQQSVRNEDGFYQLHRWYLWISALQWSLGWIWLALFVRRTV